MMMSVAHAHIVSQPTFPTVPIIEEINRLCPCLHFRPVIARESKLRVDAAKKCVSLSCVLIRRRGFLFYLFPSCAAVTPEWLARELLLEEAQSKGSAEGVMFFER